MSLRRRNIIAWILLVLSVIAWTYGQQMIRTTLENYAIGTTDRLENTTYPHTIPADGSQYTFPTANSVPTMDSTTVPSRNQILSTAQGTQNGQRSQKMTGSLLCFASAAAAIVAVLVLWQKAPVLGPDGVAVLMAAAGWIHDRGFGGASVVHMVLMFVTLLSVRELWGWVHSKLSLPWCLVHRLAGRCPAPQLSLMVYVGWILAAMAPVLMLYGQPSLQGGALAYMLLDGILGVCCLWKYGADLRHFEQQLDHFQNGLPITVKNGAFGQTEEQLLRVQSQHEEAVRTAVTSERFKVELISNVSHDLRTPLTSILGYGELLQKESLSPTGQEQLFRLNQKAGYMRDLVESLFELTKVSSGVIEAKKEEIDLIRLLEQTIGLFDDQLAEVGLLVRRRYAADSIQILTDGARIHQVFANLLGNAIKYAMPGTRIYLEVTEHEDSCRIRMMNTSSYEMDFQPEEIMQRFARGDKARSTKGSGLGLAIAQTYTESIGGQFSIAVDGDQFSALVTLPKTERNL